MSRKTWTILIVLTLTIAVSGLVIFASGDAKNLQRNVDRDARIRPLPTEGFQLCPTPACMAPCQFGAPPEVLCKSPDGSVSQSTWACCCCGGSGSANQFKPL